MAEVCTAPYGAWKSPITTDFITAAAVGLGGAALDGGDVCWLEMRPAEGGRYVLVRRAPDGTTRDVTPAGMNVRTGVHEYGGGAYAVEGGEVFFANWADQRLYRQGPGEAEARPITPEGDLRYADGVIDRRRGRLVCVREDHTGGGEAVNAVVSLDLAGEGEALVLAAGYDFYSNPRLSPDGERLAWLAWRHPNMPWDGTELWVGKIREDGSMGVCERLAGDPGASIFQPEWSPEGMLHFASDHTGWWNLYRLGPRGLEALCPPHLQNAEFGMPQWVFGMSTYAFTRPGRMVCAYTQNGEWRLARLDYGDGEGGGTAGDRAGGAAGSEAGAGTAGGGKEGEAAREGGAAGAAGVSMTPLELPYTEIREVRAGGGRAVVVAGSPTEPVSIVSVDPESGAAEVLRRASDARVDEGYLSRPQAIEFPTEGGLTAHAFYYAPRNRDFQAPDDERPPLIVASHGGPTGAASATLSWGTQYWTSRGFAVLDVNYGGSTGYGRAYRERLNGRWGIVDLDDCINGARYLIERGLADAERTAVHGGSAGGYTTLAALTFRDFFRAGASYFGISELEAMAKETHKFESRYLDRLIAPYPEGREVYQARSPINHTDRLGCPMILFQGLEDKIVPPNQAEMMVEALRAKGLPVAYLAYEGEQHGFRKAENIKRTLEAELYFYGRVFGFTPADEIEPVEIENL